MTALLWTAVVPVKRTEHAKSRLTGIAGAQRERLALAFATDTVAALRRCPLVASVIVVTDDAQATRVLSGVGADVVTDEPDAGLNPALAHGAAVAAARWPRTGTALVSADLPALRDTELTRVLQDAARHGTAFVCDCAGVGTTVLTALPGVAPAPSFGARSRAAHRAAGLVEIGRLDVASVRRDVDTWVDMWDAVRMGVGPATAAQLPHGVPQGP